MSSTPGAEEDRSIVATALLVLVGAVFVALGALIFQAVIGGPFETPGQRQLGVRAGVSAAIAVVLGGVLIYTAVDRRYWRS